MIISGKNTRSKQRLLKLHSDNSRYYAYVQSDEHEEFLISMSLSYLPALFMCHFLVFNFASAQPDPERIRSAIESVSWVPSLTKRDYGPRVDRGPADGTSAHHVRVRPVGCECDTAGRYGRTHCYGAPSPPRDATRGHVT